MSDYCVRVLGLITAHTMNGCNKDSSDADSPQITPSISTKKRSKANRTRRTLCCHDRTHEGRIRKTPFQLDMLKSRYAFSPFISHPEAEKLSLVTNLSVWQIKRWFSDRRYDRRSRHHHNRATAAAHVKHEEDNDDTTDQQQHQNPPAIDDGGDTSCNDEPMADLRTSDVQLERLTEEFEKDPYPTDEAVHLISREIGMSFLEISSWFINRRISNKICLVVKCEKLEPLDDSENEDV